MLLLRRHQVWNPSSIHCAPCGYTQALRAEAPVGTWPRPAATRVVSVCRGLFEKDKAVYAFSLASEILLQRGDLSSIEWNAFLTTISPSDQDIASLPTPAQGKESWLKCPLGCGRPVVRIHNLILSTRAPNSNSTPLHYTRVGVPFCIALLERIAILDARQRPVQAKAIRYRTV